MKEGRTNYVRPFLSEREVRNYFMGKILEEYRGYYIKQTSRDYIVCTKDDKKHSHFKRIEGCRQLIDLMVLKKIPKQKYFIKAAMRLLDTECEYYLRLCRALHAYEGIQECIKRSAYVDHTRCQGRY